MKTATSLPIRHELLLLGGGHSHVTVIRHFGMRPLPGVRLTVVSRDVHTPYSGMLPGLIAGHYTVDDCHIDLRALCAANGARLVHATARGIDRLARRVLLEGRAPLAYDWLSIDTGSRPALDGIAGAEAHGIAVKPIDHFLRRWLGTLEQLRQHPRPFHLLVVGGGAAGIPYVDPVPGRHGFFRTRAPCPGAVRFGPRSAPAQGEFLLRSGALADTLGDECGHVDEYPLLAPGREFHADPRSGPCAHHGHFPVPE